MPKLPWTTTVQEHGYTESTATAGRRRLYVKEHEPVRRDGSCSRYMLKEKGGNFTAGVDNQSIWRSAPPPDMNSPYFEGLETAQLAAEKYALTSAREIIKRLGP